MKKNHYLLFAAFACLFACNEGDDNKKADSEKGDIIPDSGAAVPEWARAKNQMFMLVGKVESVKETLITFESNEESYVYKFDKNGNLKEQKHDYINVEGSGWKKLTYEYDGRHRLLKRTESSDTYPDGSLVWEYEYDGSHGVYIPSRCIEFNEGAGNRIFLQPGISKIKVSNIHFPEKIPLTSKCTVKNGQLVFDVIEGDFSNIFEVIRTGLRKITVDCKGNYPTALKAFDASNRQKLSMSLSQKNGYPDVLNFENLEKITYTSIKKVPVITQKEIFNAKSGEMVYQVVFGYNDKGLRTHERLLSGKEYRYTYEYDRYGNWIKCTEEYHDGAGSPWKQSVIKQREYTYFK